MPHVMKVRDSAEPEARYPVATHCAKCSSPMIVPEPYVSWFRRVFDEGIEKLRIHCRKCGGPTLDNYMHYSKAWTEAPTLDTQKLLNVVDEEKEAPATTHHRQSGFYEDGDYGCYSKMGFHSYTSSFITELNKLKAFIEE